MPSSAETRSPRAPATANHAADGATPSYPRRRARTPEQVTPRAGGGDEFPAIPCYEVLGKLGQGGMGAVYRARQRSLGREVAIKTLIEPTTSPAILARFWAEAEVMAEVKHPNVVQVIELGVHAGKPFTVMEFVAGGSLADRLRARGQLSPTEAARLMERVARGVAAAHELGVVHRDLKPGNVLMDGDNPKVADFGLAKRRSHDLTQTAALMGTPAYMAPEQAAARAKFVGPTADVWALGVMLYECVSGARPFVGETVLDVLAKIADENPPALPALVGGVPRDLQTIVAKCLSKEPELRYPTAKELADDLSRFLSGEPIAARPLGAAERLARWVRRKPTAAAAYGFSALAVALALVVFVVAGLWRGAEEARDQAIKQEGIADDAKNEALSLKIVAERALVNEAALKAQVQVERDKLAVLEYGRTLQVAHQECRENNVRSAGALIEGTDPRLRGWEWHYVHRLCNGSLLTLRGHKFAVQSVSFSPDGARVVTGSWDRTAKVWDAKTGTELLTLKGHTDAVLSACFSTDGARIVTAGNDRTAKVWDAHTGTELLTLKGHGSVVYSACFSTDGARIVTGGRDKTAKVWDAGAGTELFTLKGHADVVQSASFNPDGTRIVTAGGDGTAKVWDANTGAELLTFKGHTQYVWSARFSPDGARVVTGSWDRTAKVWNANTGAELLTLKGHADAVWSVCFSPDGTRIVTAGNDRTARVWDAGTGAELLTPKGHSDHVMSACFSPDGTRIATACGDETARVWDAGTGAEFRTLKGHADHVYSAGFSPDGARVVTGSWDETAKVWDAVTGTELLTLKGHESVVYSACFSPDGTRVLTGSLDRTARVWDARTGTELLTLKGHAQH
ncbi:MAG: protein kinase, partial [Planctomycetes bacterium]|nr:protein kinase [Planctomycetota bacterium]